MNPQRLVPFSPPRTVGKLEVALGKIKSEQFCLNDLPGGGENPAHGQTTRAAVHFFTVYVDASSTCHLAAFDISSGSSTSRNWDIKVTQYECGARDAGDDGCLQYHTGTSGTIARYDTTSTILGTIGIAIGSLSSFNFPTADTMIGISGEPSLST